MDNNFNKCIEGIHCDAEKCAFNQNCKCTASSIHVGNHSACCSGDTCCDTFIEK